jgi:hypothetical protein
MIGQSLDYRRFQKVCTPGVRFPGTLGSGRTEKSWTIFTRQVRYFQVLDRSLEHGGPEPLGTHGRAHKS